MNTNPGNMHDWEFERESARHAEIQDAIADRISDLEQSSGHGKEEHELMQRVLEELSESSSAAEIFKTHLFKLWQMRANHDPDQKRKIARAAQALANTIAPILRDIVSSDVHTEFRA